MDHADWPTWKTRFRCALNKLPDIQEMKDYNQLDGTDPFRAYKFLSKEGTVDIQYKWPLFLSMIFFFNFIYKVENLIKVPDTARMAPVFVEWSFENGRKIL